MGVTSKLRVGILGASGYVGMEFLRTLLSHPGFRVTYLSSRSYAGQIFSDIYPMFRGLCDVMLSELSLEKIEASCDIVVTALPHGVSAELVPQLLERGVKVLDHSGDFRFDKVRDYERAYKLKHPAPKLLKTAVYGLPELYRDALRRAALIANPGCYPTCTILALAPLLKAGLVDTQSLIADAVSGASGAGRKADTQFSFCELDEDFRPYGVVAHRHHAEIVQELSKLAGEPVKLAFTPHLAPFKRGMLVSAYARPRAKTLRLGTQRAALSSANLCALYEAHYKFDAFVRVLKPGLLPCVKAVRGSNYIDISPVYDPDSGLIKVFSALDNLGKGAATQAVQSLNLLAAYPETEGLAHALFAL